MAGVKLTGDWRGAVRSLENLAAFSMIGLHKEIGAELVASTKKRFRAGKGPDGKEWPKSKRVEEKGGQTLVDTGRLRSSVTYRAFPDRVEVGTNDKRARIHQLGGVIKPKRKKLLKFAGADGKTIVAKQVKMPSRPFLGISDDDEKAIAEIVETAVRRCIE